MKFWIICLWCLGTGIGFAKKHHPWTLASEVFSTAKPAQSDHSPKAMASAAKAFLATLSDEEKAVANLKMNDPERRKWTNVPARPDDRGIRLGDLTRPQLEKACHFLSTILSEAGYLKARNIMLADDLLISNEARAHRRGGLGAANYWIVIFGNPSETEPWAVQWDGHHLAVNLTIAGERMTNSPSFIGTQPRAFMLGKEEIVPMEKETALGYQFMKSLSAEQRRQAMVAKSRGRMKAGAGRDGVMPEQRGLACDSLSKEQTRILLDLTELWVSDLPEWAAKARLAEVEKQLAKASFAWQGPFEPDSDVSYHLIGPGIIIEYAGQDLGGDPLNHLHSIYRNPENEYGSRWLKN